MNEPGRKPTPQELGQVEIRGRCQVCGTPGSVIALPGATPPNAFCPRCAIEYGQTAVDPEGEGLAGD